MFSWRIRRQLAALVLIGIAAGAAVIFFGRRFIPVASCFDHRQNRGEVGVDCGGPCEPCELKNPKQLAIFWARVARAGPGSVDAAAFVENLNEVLSSAAVRYQFTLFDKTGIIGEKTGTTFIYPQERLVIVEPGIPAVRDPERVEFRVTGVSWTAGREAPPAVIVEERSQNVITEAVGKKSIVEASLFNASPYGFRAVETAIAVFDEKENLIGANKVISIAIPAGGRIRVRSIWADTFHGHAVRIEIYPRVNLFREDAFIKP